MSCIRTLSPSADEGAQVSVPHEYLKPHLEFGDNSQHKNLHLTSLKPFRCFHCARNALVIGDLTVLFHM